LFSVVYFLKCVGTVWETAIERERL